MGPGGLGLSCPAFEMSVLKEQSHDPWLRKLPSPGPREVLWHLPKPCVPTDGDDDPSHSAWRPWALAPATKSARCLRSQGVPDLTLGSPQYPPRYLPTSVPSKWARWLGASSCVHLPLGLAELNSHFPSDFQGALGPQGPPGAPGVRGFQVGLHPVSPGEGGVPAGLHCGH